MGNMENLEVRRQLFHITVGVSLSVMFYIGWINRKFFVALFGIFATLFLINKHRRLPLLHNFISSMERKHILCLFPGMGAVFLMLGMALSVILFPRDVAAASILIVAISDGIASLIGPYGMRPYFNPNKTWEGILIAIIAGAMGASYVVPLKEALPAAVVAMLIEGLDLKLGKWKIDDNLTVPLIAGGVIMLLRIYI